MKKIRKLLAAAITLSVMMISMVFVVCADTTTDLSSMKVYGVDASGKKTEVPMNFNSTTYTYDLTVKSDIVSIEIEAKTVDAASKWIVEKQGVNTKMDTGNNLTVVAVTSQAGRVQKYTLNTKKLTTAEEATYKEPEGSGGDKPVDKTDKDTSVKVGKKTMKISSSFPKSAIPEGFKKTSQQYKGKKYNCIKGEVKDLTAFYLYNSNTEGFYIYNQEKDEFYVMNNIKIKSRMYTIINPEETDGILENYTRKKITIVDTSVKAWALDEEEGMYLVYAMNWNGEKSLYCYDDKEQCFQRYLVSNDANNQSEAAAKAYNNLHKDYNKLVDKYNVLIKILCGFVILIIILIFVIINLALNKKEKKIKNAKYVGEDEEISDETALKQQKKSEKKNKKQSDKDIKDEDDIDYVSDDKSKEAGDPKEIQNDVEQIEKEIQKEIAAELAKQSEDANVEEGYYGGEIEEENEIFIDLVDDEKSDSLNSVDGENKDLKESVGYSASDEQRDEEDEDDFEFIDLD